MTRDVWLMRHGRAEGSSPSGDAGRHLTADGARGIEHIARFARDAGWSADELWHSPYVRATQTADRMHQSVSGQRRIDERLTPSGRVVSTADALRLASGSVFVVSHLPFLPALLEELLGGGTGISISPGTVVHLAMIGPGNALVRGVYEPDVTEALGARLPA